VCTAHGIDPSRCLPTIAEPRSAGVAVTATDVVPDRFDVDTPYDFTFAVFGVSNTSPYFGMPMSLTLEGCPYDPFTRGLDAIPIGFTFLPHYVWLKSNLDKIEIRTRSGFVEKVECITMTPNAGNAERVVVAVGYYRGESDPPVAITIRGPMMMANGAFTSNAVLSSAIGILNIGTVCIYAESYTAANTPVGISWPAFFVMNAMKKNVCPVATTTQIILTTWTKGTRQSHPGLVTTPSGDPWTQQARGVTVLMKDGSTLTWLNFTIADDDNDNYVQLCLGTTDEVESVSFEKGLFFDPRNTMNQDQTIPVNQPLPPFDPYPYINANAITTPDTAPPTSAPTSAPTSSPTPKGKGGKSGSRKLR
jgi:hypothetical protein